MTRLRLVEYSGPVFDGIIVEGKRRLISLKHVGGGLMVNGDKLTGFNLAGADGKIIPAEAVIEGKNVVVTSDEIAKPISVRFAWATVPHVNLFNQEGLFAAPFSTKL